MNSLVIGIGNESRGDDGVGLIVARRLRQLNPPETAILELDGEAARLMDAWKGAPAVFVIDAAQSGAPPGTIQRFDATNTDLPAEFLHRSTHDMGLAEAVALGRALNALPDRLIIYAIEGAGFTPGAGLHPTVERAAEAVAERTLNELKQSAGSA